MKKNYNQPEVTVTQVALESMILAVSPANNTLDFHNIEGDQW